MKDDPKFNVTFVESVERRPCLYNYTLKEYSSKEAQERAWKEVAEEVDCSVAACKERWKNLRASLCRHLRQQLGAPGTKTKRPYYLADYMQFVMPYTKIRPIQKTYLSHFDTKIEAKLEAKLEETENDEETFNYYQDIEETAAIIQDVEESEMLQLTSIQTPSSSKLHHSLSYDTLKQKSLDPIELCELEYCSTKKQKLENSENADLMFFKSLLPDMKKMTDKQKITFKRSVLTSINDILYEECNDPSQSHSTS
ncbi:UNVERIFIED_CONTAM: hypothetical protein RMT77_016096 [Armadillidium vulgare]